MTIGRRGFLGALLAIPVVARFAQSILPTPPPTFDPTTGIMRLRPGQSCRGPAGMTVSLGHVPKVPWPTCPRLRFELGGMPAEGMTPLYIQRIEVTQHDATIHFYTGRSYNYRRLTEAEMRAWTITYTGADQLPDWAEKKGRPS